MARRGDMTSLHERIVSLKTQGLLQVEIAAVIGRSERCISHHINNNCVCGGPKFIYVPSAWFKCRLRGCGWFDRNGCQHSWELTI